MNLNLLNKSRPAVTAATAFSPPSKTVAKWIRCF